MKKLLLPILLLISAHGYSQTVFGYWYGTASIKSNGAANNYLVELILQPEKGYVKGVMNYYFKNMFRSLQVKGNYNSNSRQLSLYEIPLPYHAAPAGMEIDCIMNMQATHRVAKAGSNLVGSFVSLPETRYTCIDITFNLSLNADVSVQDSVLKAIREYKETHQVWSPGRADTIVGATVIQRRVINYVVEDLFKKRENIIASEIEVTSDSVTVDFYDNGEVDGDSISVFYNNQLLAFSQRLSTKSIQFRLGLDSAREVNEISMFADNLGRIPPNTALMIVTDGDKQHEVRLTSDLNRNAVLRLKKKQR